MPGQSAHREYERLRHKRVAFIRDRFWLLVLLTLGVASVLGSLSHVYLDAWWLGAVVAALLVASKLAPTQGENAFARGAVGERIVGAALDSLEGDSVVVLHDRLIPRSRANIDHLVVGPSGVWAVDAKRYKGRIEARARGRELWVNGRNRSKLLDQSDRQVAVASKVLRDAEHADVPVRGVLCFTGVEWPWLFPPREIRGVRVTSPKGLPRLVGGEARSVGDVNAVADALASALKPAIADRATAEKPDTPLATRTSSRDQQSPEGARYEYFAAPTASGRGSPVPSCVCGAEMVRRRRRSDGRLFWGCSAFPSCCHTRSIDDASSG